MKKVMIITNHAYMLYRFRLELIRELMKEHEVVLPSHHEGMSNVLLEAAATGRPRWSPRIFPAAVRPWRTA